mgnify:CR=1 FL=1
MVSAHNSVRLLAVRAHRLGAELGCLMNGALHLAQFVRIPIEIGGKWTFGRAILWYCYK